MEIQINLYIYRNRETERQRDRDTERQRYRETEIQRHKIKVGSPFCSVFNEQYGQALR